MWALSVRHSGASASSTRSSILSCDDRLVFVESVSFSLETFLREPDPQRWWSESERSAVGYTITKANKRRCKILRDRNGSIPYTLVFNVLEPSRGTLFECMTVCTTGSHELLDVPYQRIDERNVSTVGSCAQYPC